MRRGRPMWLRLYRLSLRALPSTFRERHAGELEQLVSDRIDEAAFGEHRIRRCAVGWHRALTEISDVIRVGVILRLQQRRSGVYAESSEPTPFHQSGVLPMRTTLRSLRRRPAFASLAVLTLLLGVGASTTIFATVDAILLRPLPHADGDRLVMVWRTIPRLGFDRSTASYPDYLDLRAATPGLAELAAYSGAASTLQSDAGPARLIGARVSGNLFRALGNAPAIGRSIAEDDDHPAAERVIVLSNALWRERFGADSAVLGRSILLDEAPHLVIGVMPASFEFPSERARFWVPLRLDPATAERDGNFLVLIGRLRQDVGIDVARSQVEAAANRIALGNPGMNEGYGVRLERRHDFVVEPVRPVLVLVGAAVAVLLAISLANLVNLQLVRAAGRRRDFALRRALGATGSHVAREQLAEALWIAAFGMALGVGLAVWLTVLLQRFGPALPRGGEIAIDIRAMLFAGVVAVGCAVAGVVIGAFVERHRSPGEVLAGGSRSSAGRGVRRTQEALVVAQLALALTLFVGAGLLGRSFVRLVTVPRGFEGEQVLTAKISLPPARYGGGRILGFYDELLGRLSALPGAVAASGTWALPFSQDWASGAIVPADRPVPDDPPQVVQSPIRPGFLAVAGMSLREGRDFTSADDADAPGVAIVNETLARRYWPAESAVGKQLRSGDPEEDERITIVGVVGDIKRRGLAVPVEPEMFLPHAQAAWTGDLYIAVRASGDPHALAPALRRTVAELDPLLPITSLATLDELVEESVVGPRFRALLVGGFAVIAGLLAAIGIYGVLVFAVAQRRHEIAVRAALGATPRRVRYEILARALGVASLGIVLGLLGTAAAAPLVRGLLFEMQPFDAVTYIGGVLLLGSVAVAGAWIPARRAARVDPMLTLRENA